MLVSFSSPVLQSRSPDAELSYQQWSIYPDLQVYHIFYLSQNFVWQKVNFRINIVCLDVQVFNLGRRCVFLVLSSPVVIILFTCLSLCFRRYWSFVLYVRLFRCLYLAKSAYFTFFLTLVFLCSLLVCLLVSQEPGSTFSMAMFKC